MNKHPGNHIPLPGYRELIEQMFCEIILAQHLGKITGLIYIILNNNSADPDNQQAANHLKKLADENYLLYYLKKNHFCYLAKQLRSPNQAARFAETIINSQNEKHYSLNIGIALYPGSGDNQTTLLQNARRAAHKSTLHDTDNFNFHHRKLGQAVMRNIRLEADLRSAIEKKQLILHYQPQHELNTLKIVGAEALIRWNHPEFGLVSPLTFIPIAEKKDLIIDIGEWVIKTACQQYQQWNLDHSIKLAINVSPIQLLSYYFIDHVNSILKKTNIDPRCIEFELTENSYIQDFEPSLTKLKMLVEFGIHLSIDDYGTGYSTLHYLKRLPIHNLKIDKSYIATITQSNAEKIIVKSTIEMAHALGLSVTAEGIETEQQLALLKTMGCDIGQGYYFSRPLDGDSFYDYAKR